MEYLIYTDVSADVDISFAKDNDVKYIPMEYVLGEETVYCNGPESDERMHNFYNSLRQKVVTQTSQITPNHYYEVFEPLVKEGQSILYIVLSSGLSNTYESALLAVSNLKEEYDNVNIEVVDSLGATGGMGLMIEAAVKNQKSGMTLSENAKWLRDHANNINYWFVVEDLMYLKRGGRVSAASAVMGTALNIKPILTIKQDGRLETIDKKRGVKIAIKSMVERFDKNFDESTDTVYICGADCPENVEAMKKAVLERQPNVTIKTTMLSPIIGAHTGPDMVALIYFGTEREYK